MKRILHYTFIVAIAATIATAQPSPKDEASVVVGGKTISVKYSAPSVRGRTIFGDSGLLSGESHFPVWRAGANEATALHTDVDIEIGALKIPKGDYTLFVSVKDPSAWELIVSKDTGEWGTEYKEKLDLGRVKMTMSKPSALVERLKYDLTSSGAGKAKLTLTWENHVASVAIAVK
jgi:hypothetical protein